MTKHALETRFTALHDSLPRIPLTALPTPLEPAESLAGELGLEALHIKRDDRTGSVYGGNKVRKLEYLLGDALHRNCDSVVTYGAIGSNHALATAIYASRLGLNCHVVMTEQPATPWVARTLRYHALLGTQLELARNYAEVAVISDRLLAQHPTGADKLDRIPAGGSSPLGVIGFANAALELAEQCAEAPPDAIYVACGTMGTVAGLALGLRLAGLETRIEAVRVVPETVSSLRRLAELIVATNRKMQAIDGNIPVMKDPLARVTLRGEFFGPAYAVPTDECREAIRMIRESEAIELETTYTGKALSALIHDARNRELTGQRIVFWNTYNSVPYPAAVDDVSDASLPGWAQPFLCHPDLAREPG